MQIDEAISLMARAEIAKLRQCLKVLKAWNLITVESTAGRGKHLFCLRMNTARRTHRGRHRDSTTDED